MILRIRGVAATSIAAVCALVLVGSAVADNIAGTPKNDVLRGTARSDRISGGAGNDVLYGMGSADTLNGGPGDDKLVGGPGADVLQCGAGRDVAVADAQDRTAPDCETILGLPKPDVVVADVSADEGNSGAKVMEFAVVLTKASSQRVTVAFATKDGTASAPSDYTAASGRLAFAPGETRKSIGITIVGDTEVEANETFSVVLSDPVNAKLGRGTASGTITNEDVPKPKAGHYAGTTSQGRSVAFDVNPELTGVSRLVVYLDISCPSVGVNIPNEPLEFPQLLLSGDWMFSITDSASDSKGSIAVRFSGALGIDRPATGSIRVDLVINTMIGPVSCSTGDVTWSANPSA